ncbi:hypothetical protein BIW11_03436 [Tropilaelaps mercedesae]|uniref:Uncharacterized protein n=1 Tax=Tropilaelaps mercedesae TaxID=418985 RepID=A0A1V9XLD3_9ACAR|nr:hypothetical protein BIW11_03436 [Tropilaelaps mercedesae]
MSAMTRELCRCLHERISRSGVALMASVGVCTRGSQRSQTRIVQ